MLGPDSSKNKSINNSGDDLYQKNLWVDPPGVTIIRWPLVYHDESHTTQERTDRNSWSCHVGHEPIRSLSGTDFNGIITGLVALVMN